MVHHASFAAAALPIVISRALRTRPDVVLAIAPSLLSTLPARIGAVLGRARLWVHVQDFEADAALATGLVRTGVLTRGLFAVERAILRAADVVSTIGPQMMERLRQKGVPAERTFEWRNWASAAAPAASAGGSYRSEWNLQDRKVALYAGSLGRKQGAGLILAAARLLAKRADIAFVICGEGPELEALKAEARDLGNVRFNPLQPVERLGELLAMADFHLLPQITAAADLVLPSKLTNMLLSRRPVVATAEPGTGLDAEVEGCGIVVPPGDAVALATAVAQLADDPALARRLGEAAGVRAAERWSRTAILARFERRLGALAAEGGGAHFGVVTAPSDP
jgi:colanic acid biosynthesis glycosyl transferase WcaI